MNKLRYLNFGHIEGKKEAALWRFPTIWEIEQPTLFIRQPLKDELGCLGTKSLRNLVNFEQLGDIDLCRFYKAGDSPGMLHKPSSLHIHLILPVESKSWLIKGLKATVFKTLRELGIDCVESSNDIFVEHDGKKKKIYGMINCEYSNWFIAAFTITFDINYELAERVYKLDTEKFTKKEEFNSLKDIMVGLREVDSKITPESFLPIFLSKISERLELEIEKDQLTSIELQRLNELTEKMGSRNWMEEGIWPE